MIAPQFRPLIGGYERAAERLCVALAERGFRVTVIAERRVRSWPVREIVQGYEVRRLPCLYRRRLHVVSSLLVFGIYMLLHGRRFQVLHVHQYGPHAALAVVLGKLLRRPVVLKLTSSAATGIEKALGKGIRGRLLSFLHRWVSACLAVSEETRTEAIQFGIPPERVHLIPNGVDPRSFRPASPKERADVRRALGLECQRLVLCVGRLSPEKNPLGLLEAWAAVDEAVREGSLLALVGDGPLRATLTDSVAAKGLSESVQIVGERNDVACWMRAADLYVLASYTEGLSNTLLEAMASGLPVVSTRVSGSIETVEGAGAGLLVDVGRVDRLSEAMARMLTDTALRERMGQAGRALIEAKYSTDVVAQACLRLYRSLMPVPAVGRSNV
jgi:glycosyltransferase involved in cell wall biosynthesis